VVPYVGLNFGVYETLKAMMLKHYDLRDERDLSVAARLAAGAAAGTTGQTVAYPFDVARRRLQVGVGGVQGVGGMVAGTTARRWVRFWDFAGWDWCDSRAAHTCQS
jgi:hypothetical protein